MARRRVQRVKPVWRVFWDAHGNYTNNVTANTATSAAATQTLLTAAEMHDFDDYGVLKRVVGEHYWAMHPETATESLINWSCFFGLLVADSSYTSTDINLETPADVQDLQWLWLRCNRGTGSTWGNGNEGGNMTNLSDSGAIMNAHIDVKVARRLGAGDQLYWYTSAYATTTAGDWKLYYNLNLRLLMEV